MPKGDEKEVVQITRVEWNQFCNKLDNMSDMIDKIYVKLFGDPDIKGDGGLYERDKVMWEAYNENKFWKSKQVAIGNTIGWILSAVGAVIAIILSSRQL